MNYIKTVSLLVLLFSTGFSYGRADLYSKSFGDPSNPCIIFLHGGPGYNCASFEFTTAEKLAEKGFYVIVYDRRGEGRSADPKAKFNFKESFKDIQSLYKQYDIDKSTLVGHSFGGLLATKFALKNPDLVKSVILVSSPICFQQSFKTIIDSSKQIYTKSNDKTNLKYISMLEQMDSTSLDYAVYCFAHAMQNGFYTTSSPTEEAKAIYEFIRSDSTAKKFASEMTQAATAGFWKNESYTTIDIRSDLKELIQNGIPVYGFYGMEDGLFSTAQIKELGNIIGTSHLNYLENCSHSVFIDKQEKFLESLLNLCKK